MSAKIAAMPLLQPLSEATATALEPLPLGTQDYLEIDTDDEARKFKVHAVAYKPATLGGCRYCDKTELEHANWLHRYSPAELVKFPDGREMQRDVDGPTLNARYNWLDRVPEKTQGSDGEWVLGGTDFTALVIQHLWPADRLIFKSEAASLMYNFLLQRFNAQNRNAVITANFKVNRIIPDLPPDFIKHPEFPPLDFQQVGLAVTCFQECSALFMAPGTGKTATSINRICFEAARKVAGRTVGVQKGMYRVLVVCPNQVRLNWQMEFAKFATIPGKSTILRGGPINRMKKLRDGIRTEDDCAWAAVIIGWDSVESMLDILKQIPFDLVVADESHYMKGSYTARWKAMIQLRENTRQRMILTGTPIANTVMDLWAQFEWLAEGMSGFMTYGAFRKFHGQYVKGLGGSHIEKLVGLKNIPLIQERLARISFMVTIEEAGLKLPEKVYDVVEVEMTKVQTTYYRQVCEQLALELEEVMTEGSDIADFQDGMGEGDGESPIEGAPVKKRLTANHVLTKLLRLAQITSGFVKWDEQRNADTGEVVAKSRCEQIPGENPKLTALMDNILADDNDPNCKHIIWCKFREDIRAIADYLEEEEIGFVEYHGGVPDNERDAQVDRFNNDPTCKVIIANPQIAKEGLNLLGYDLAEPDRLEAYCGWEHFFSQGWSSLERSQAEARAHRKGTKRPVRITDYMVPGTIDQEIRERVTKKIDTAIAIQDVREILKTLLDFNNSELVESEA